MYESHFGLSERPFSIAPDPQYLYMSQQHKEAMAHLQYGLTQGGGFILLTGEVGTGKTTLCRNLLNTLPDNVNIALILNSKIQGDELLQTICDELKIKYKEKDTHKALLTKLNDFLFDGFANNRRTVLIIDEAQLLSRDVLEQIRMLTNLETTKTKLLQIILIGQPELNELLARQDLRQLAQRITARYHLKSIAKQDIEDYVTTRLRVAGCARALFTKQSLNKVFKITNGIPRLINVLCDNALLVAYSKGANIVDAKTVKLASKEILNPVVEQSKGGGFTKHLSYKGAVLTGISALVAIALFSVFTPKIAKVINQPEEKALSKELVEVKAQKTVAEIDYFKTEGGSAGIEGKSIKTVVDSEQEEVVNSSPDFAKEVANALTITKLDDLPALLASPNLDTSRTSAFKRLAKLWGHDNISTAIPLCDTVRALDIDCFASVGNNLYDLLSYDRPASIVLQSSGEHRILVLGSNDDELLIDVDGIEYRVSRNAVEQLWDGRFLIFWQSPEIKNLSLSVGANNARVVWLRQQINFALFRVGREGLLNTSSTLYDAQLADVVRELQAEYGVPVDGAIGIKTMMVINKMIDTSLIPQLKVLASTDSVNAEKAQIGGE